MVTVDEVLRIAALAKLALSPGEAEKLAVELASILEHMGVLGAGEAADAAGAAGAAGAAAQRADLPAAHPLAFPAQQLSPAFESDFFTVPRLVALDSDA